MKTIYWNVDTQYDFMRNDEDYKGLLPIDGAKDIEITLKKITNYARGTSCQIVSTGDWHNLNSKEFSNEPDFKETFPTHCLHNTRGAKFIPATNPVNPLVIDWKDESFDETLVKNNGEIVIYKDAFDVFEGSPHTNKILDIVNPNMVVVYGVATNVCVDFAVNGLVKRGYKVIVYKDGIKELPGVDVNEIYTDWKLKGVLLIDFGEIV